MNFTTFKRYGGTTPVLVNLDQVKHVDPLGAGHVGSTLVFVDDATVDIAETPSEVRDRSIELKRQAARILADFGPAHYR